MASTTDYKCPPVLMEDGDTPKDVLTAWGAEVKPK